ncbi:hypothetical protein NP233_g12325 [Leucocoprinus birnbaumii]|uniref:HMG domain-containing protein n=1 Tax=Leucocoprinus birnbaumii TaxID=56174 RepID=A0AAD5YQ47_9AGAR|nr:hypothetical protein NP233_g12325 [Leucocoprinus birnbaumii]
MAARKRGRQVPDPQTPDASDDEPLKGIFTSSPGETEFASPEKKEHAKDTKARAKRAVFSRQPEAKKQRLLIEDITPFDFEASTTSSETFVDFGTVPKTSVPGIVVSQLDIDGTNSLDRDFEAYMEAAVAGCAGFCQIARDLCVVQGWDSRREQSTHFWYHLHFVKAADKLLVACQCSKSKCVHQRFLRDYFEEKISVDPGLSASPKVVLFDERQTNNEYRYTFSVSTYTTKSPMSRAIVVYEGPELRGGSWTCSKDSKQRNARHTRCTHIKTARAELYRQLGLETRSDGESEDDEEGVDDEGEDGTVTLARDISNDYAVSWLPILPPLWAALHSDKEIYPQPKPIYTKPEDSIFKLTKYSSCRCFDGQRMTHDLLNDYTCASSASETPFDAWAETMCCRYSLVNCRFLLRDVLRGCWFSFARLQQFAGDFVCPDCGPHPENVLWDGVTLAFHQKHLLDSIRPPTSISANPPLRPNVKYFPHQQLLPSPDLRKALRKAIRMGSIETITERIEEAKKEHPKKNGKSKGGTRLVDDILDELDWHLECVMTLSQDLKEVNEGLAEMFVQFYGVAAYRLGTEVPREIQEFFEQIAAEESVLQLVNGEANKVLQKFVSDPSHQNASALLGIPHLYRVLRHEVMGCPASTPYSKTVLSICKWLLERASFVYDELLKRASEFSPGVMEPIEEDWEQKRLTGGIMVAWCPHSIAYGFHCIPNSEGRNDAFSAMITRWPKAPRQVIYDFACALGPYCMLREPEFFSETYFMIDGFHERDHTKCAPACFASTYAQVDPSMSIVNTSAAESGNSLILRIRKAVSYMSQRRAIIYTKVFLSIMNRIKIRRRLEQRQR